MTWNNLRALELLRARTDVDARRIGCTGESGGGQQTYYLTALPCGLAAAAPAVMACHFEDILHEGDVHCACNHTPHLASAVDMPAMAAAFAPRPQFFLSVTGDWTRRFPKHGFPAVRKIYELFGAGDAVSEQQWDKGHTYDQEMREAAYAFFTRALGVPQAAPLREPRGGVRCERPEALAALDVTGVPRAERAIVAEFHARLAAPRGRSAAEVQRSLRALLLRDAPGSAKPPARARTLALPQWDNVLDGEAAGWTIPSEGEPALPMLLLRARARATPPAVAVLFGENGKTDLLAREPALVTELLTRGIHVVAADVRYLGELDLGRPWRDLYGRFFGLDEGVLAVRDLRRVVAALPKLGLPADAAVGVLGLGTCGATALFAATLDDTITCAAAPQRGANYRAGARRPAISRILLHGDLDDAEHVLGARALVNEAATPQAFAERLR
jgi:dienelactone hydrolase